MRLVCQEPFVSMAAAVGVAAASDVRTVGSAGEVVIAGAVGCSTTARVMRTAASILAKTLRARRVRFTIGSSIVAPVVRMRELAVGPSTCSIATHATATPEKMAPDV